jgi:hypothetical protein
MRWPIAVALLGCHALGCRFDHGRTPSGPDDAEIDTAPDMSRPCGATKVWATDFSTDPTQLEANGDGVKDWRMRDGGMFPGLLMNGVWISAGTPLAPLDTAPKHDFATRLVATARYRNTAPPTSLGAVMWLNVDFTATTFMPLWLELRVDGGVAMQRAILHGKDAAQNDLPLITFGGLGAGMIDVELEIDPDHDLVTATVAGMTMSATYVPIPRADNDDRFATLVAYGSPSEFDQARIEVCQ